MRGEEIFWRLRFTLRNSAFLLVIWSMLGIGYCCKMLLTPRVDQWDVPPRRGSSVHPCLDPVSGLAAPESVRLEWSEGVPGARGDGGLT